TRLVTVPFVRADRATSWRVPLDGMIQGALTVVGTEGDELLVAGDSTGQVLALDRSGQSQWSAQVEGEIRHDLLALDEGRAVVVPDTAGLLHLLAADGSELWRYATEAPLAADPGTEIGRASCRAREDKPVVR